MTDRTGWTPDYIGSLTWDQLNAYAHGWESLKKSSTSKSSDVRAFDQMLPKIQRPNAGETKPTK